MSSEESSDSCSLSSSSNSISDGSEMLVGEGEGNVIAPWRFEPVRRRRGEVEEGNNSEEDGDNQQERLRNDEW